MQGPVPAGWYADPQRAGQLRWWDGQAWTQHTHPLPPQVGAAEPVAPLAPRFVVGRTAVVTVGGAPGEAADLGARIGAVLVDGLLWFALQLITVTALGMLAAIVGQTAVVTGLLPIVFFVAPMGVYAWLEGTATGQTYGKHVLRIAVVDDRSGLPGIGVWRALARQVAKVISSVPFGLGFLWALWDPQRRTWHDMMTATRVARCDQEQVRSPVAFLALVTAQPAAPPDTAGASPAEPPTA